MINCRCCLPLFFDCFHLVESNASNRFILGFLNNCVALSRVGSGILTQDLNIIRCCTKNYTLNELVHEILLVLRHANLLRLLYIEPIPWLNRTRKHHTHPNDTCRSNSQREWWSCYQLHYDLHLVKQSHIWIYFLLNWLKKMSKWFEWTHKIFIIFTVLFFF